MAQTLERLLTLYNAVLKAVLDESEASRLRNAMFNISELAEAQRKRLRRVRGLS